MKSSQIEKELISLKLALDALNQRILALEQPPVKLEIPEAHLTQAQVSEKYGISVYKLQQLRKQPEFKNLWLKEGQLTVITPQFIKLMLEKHSHYCRR